MRKHKRLTDAYRFPGCIALQTVKGVFGDSKARVIQLKRRQKKQSVRSAVSRGEASTTGKCVVSAIFPVATGVCMWKWKFDASGAGGARK